MPFTNTGKNSMLNACGITHVALFNGDPSGAGVELSGGSPVYARQAMTLPGAAGGEIGITIDEVFDCPAGATVNYVAYYDALTGGNLIAYDDVTQETFGSQGTYTLDTTTLTLT